MRSVISAAVIVAALMCATAGPAGAADTVYFAIGERHEMTSEVLGRQITLLVREPDKNDETQPLPVLYVVGSNWRGQFAHLVSIVEILESGAHIPQMLVVGVDLPDGNGVLIPGRARGDAAGTQEWLEFFADELFPYVDGNWSGARYRVVYGASNSGIFSLWALAARSDVINAVVASSPMIGWCPELFNEKLGAWFGAEPPGERALAMVWSDDDYGRVTEYAPALAERLGRDAPDWLRWSADEVSAVGHVPPGDLALGLRLVFSGWAVPSGIENVSEIVSHFESLESRFGFPVPVPAGPLSDLGFTAWQEERFADAREAFAAVSNHAPEDPLGPAGLALVAHSEGRVEEARTLARKATEMDPESDLAKRVLQRVSAAPNTED